MTVSYSILALGDSILTHSDFSTDGPNVGKPININGTQIGIIPLLEPGVTTDDILYVQVRVAQRIMQGCFNSTLPPVLGVFLTGMINDTNAIDAGTETWATAQANYTAILAALSSSVAPLNRIYAFAPSQWTDPTGSVAAATDLVVGLCGASGIACVQPADYLTLQTDYMPDGRHWSRPQGSDKMLQPMMDTVTTWLAGS